jgi:hypothetical protein
MDPPHAPRSLKGPRLAALMRHLCEVDALRDPIKAQDPLSYASGGPSSACGTAIRSNHAEA